MAEKTFDEWLADLDLNFWGTAQHKIMAAQFFERMRSGEEVVLLDTRSPEEIDYLALPFALHIPIHELPARWQEVPDDRLVAVFCSSGVRSAIGYAYLQTKGRSNVRILDARYPELAAELKPGKVLKLAQSK
ncbi:MAG: rhodanese-like domain-containing protein [Anaerolineales bacterium]|nr:rhodanese-like domain-containing protein [Anaerolineales bacterium]